MEHIVTEFLSEAFLSEGLFIVVVAYVLADIIKKATPINNQYIPAIIAVVSSIITVVTPFIEGEIVVKILKGLVLGWSATGGYETVRNIVGKKTDKSDNTKTTTK